MRDFENSDIRCVTMLFQLAFLGVEVMMIGNSTSKLIVPKLISKSEDM